MSMECTHILESGHKCQAPARTGSTFCHHHTPRTHIDPHPRETRESGPLVLPPLNSKSAVLVAVTEVVHAASERRIRFSEARTLLMGLKLAARLMAELDSEEAAAESDSSFDPAEFEPARTSSQAAAKPSPHCAGELTPGQLKDYTAHFQKAAVQHLRDQAAARATKPAAASSERDEALIALAASGGPRLEQRPSAL